MLHGPSSSRQEVWPVEFLEYLQAKQVVLVVYTVAETITDEKNERGAS